MIYALVFFSLAFSLGFLALFFWAVDNDQFNSLAAQAWAILDDDKIVKGEKNDEPENR